MKMGVLMTSSQVQGNPAANNLRVFGVRIIPTTLESGVLTIQFLPDTGKTNATVCVMTNIMGIQDVAGHGYAAPVNQTSDTISFDCQGQTNRVNLFRMYFELDEGRQVTSDIYVAFDIGGVFFKQAFIEVQSISGLTAEYGVGVISYDNLGDSLVEFQPYNFDVDSPNGPTFPGTSLPEFKAYTYPSDIKNYLTRFETSNALKTYLLVEAYQQ